MYGRGACFILPLSSSIMTIAGPICVINLSVRSGEQCRPANLTQNPGEVVSSAKGDILRFGHNYLLNLNF